MPIRRLRTFTNNKRILLENEGFRSIQGFRRNSPEYLTNDDAYRALLTLYNAKVDRLNEEARLLAEREKYLAEQLATRKKAYYKEKRSSKGKDYKDYKRANYNLLQQANKITKRI